MTAKVLTLLVVVLTVGSGAEAQSAPYKPAHRNPNGREVVGVFVSSSWCVGNRAPGLHEAVDRAKVILRDRAKDEGSNFRAAGIALDWQPDSGRVYLAEFGEFDEIGVGSNWFGLGPEIFIWADSSAEASIPQFIVYEHNVAPQGRVRFAARRILKRVYGGDAIVAWVSAGAPVP